jgi:V8-like Glu-specific endopeptidase
MGNQNSRLKLAIQDRINQSIEEEPLNLECALPSIPPSEEGITCQISPNLNLRSPSKPVFNELAPSPSEHIQIENPSAWPYSVHGRLLTSCERHTYIGSGILIGPELVLTAAQNVYKRYFNREVDKNSMKFLPGMNGSYCPFGLIEVAEIYYPKRFVNTGKDDYALIVLKKSIGDSTGYYGIKEFERDELQGKIVYKYGYEACISNRDYKFQSLWQAQGAIEIDSYRDMIHHRLDTSEGQSGSGLFIKQDDKYYVIGIHVHSSNRFNISSQAVYLNQSRIQKIKGWVKDYYRKYNLASSINLAELPTFKIRQVIKELTKFSWNKITTLNLFDNNIGPDGAIVLAKSCFPNLTTLYLSLNNIGFKGAMAISNANFPNLTQLYISGNDLGPEGATAIANAKFSKITTLDLSWNKIGPEGAEAISKANFKNLSELNISKNNIGVRGAKAIAKGKFKELSALYIYKNNIRDKGALALAEAGFEKLKTLDMSYNYIGDEGAFAIAKASFPNLDALYLYGNKFGPEALKALRQRFDH